MRMEYTQDTAANIKGTLILLAAFHHINSEDSKAGGLIMKIRSTIMKSLPTGEMLLAMDLGEGTCDRVWSYKQDAMEKRWLQEWAA